MIWAIRDTNRVRATPGETAVCPCCRDDVIAKCGNIVVWHWAHKVSDCDPWYEPESQWHLNWKKRFPDEWQESIIGRHRADVKTPSTVIELQSSPLATTEIAARELHYGRMVWVLRGDDFAKNIVFRNRGDYFSFRWKWPRKSWWAAKMPVVIDFSDHGLFLVKKIYNEVPCGGWGTWINERRFMAMTGAENVRERAAIAATA